MDQPYSALVGSNGRATIKVRPNALMAWTVQQVSVEMTTAPLGAICSLRKNGRLISPLIPTGDAAGGDPPITIGPGDYITVEWANCTPGDNGDALVVYEEVAR